MEIPPPPLVEQVGHCQPQRSDDRVGRTAHMAVQESATIVTHADTDESLRDPGESDIWPSTHRQTGVRGAVLRTGWASCRRSVERCELAARRAQQLLHLDDALGA